MGKAHAPALRLPGISHFRMRIGLVNPLHGLFLRPKIVKFVPGEGNVLAVGYPRAGPANQSIRAGKAGFVTAMF